MLDAYSANDLINEFGPVTNVSPTNLNNQPEQKISEYTIPECSAAFRTLLQNENCMAYVKKLLLRKYEA
jgi:hypothetical protein